MDVDNDKYGGNEPQRAERRPEPGVLQSLWVIFSSMKTAIVLLLIMAALSVVGTLVPPQKYDMYHSTPYNVLLALIGINLTVCTINRFGMAWRKTFHPTVDAGADQIKGMRRSEKITSKSHSVDAAAQKVVNTLKSHAYKTELVGSGNEQSIYATKGRWAIWGPYLTHLSLLLIFAGAIYGSYRGFNGYVNIVEGTSAHTVHPAGPHEPEDERDLGFHVALKKFTIGYDKEHNPVSYNSDLTIKEGDKTVAAKVINVNHPLTYKGVSFFQSSYGLAQVVLKVTRAGQKGAVEVPFEVSTQENPEFGLEYLPKEPFRNVKIGDGKLALLAHRIAPDYVGGERINWSTMPINPAVQVMVNDKYNPAKRGRENWSDPKWIAPSESIEFHGYTVSLERVVNYTGLEVSQNPGLPVIYAGFIMTLLGVFLSAYVTHRVVRVRVAPAQNATAVMLGATSRGENSSFDKDFEAIRTALNG